MSLLFKVTVNENCEWEHYSFNKETEKILKSKPISDHGVYFLTKNTPKNRLETTDDSTFMFVLRGINFEKDLQQNDMIALRIYIEKNRIISVSKLSLQTVGIVKDHLESLINANKNEKIAMKDVLLKIITTIYQKIEPVLEDLEETTNDLEYEILNKAYDSREKLSQLRLALVDYKRFLAPQKDILLELCQVGIYKNKKELAQLRNQSNTYHRWLEKIEALKEQSKILFDEIAFIQNEKLNIRTLKLTVLGGIFLPVTFLSGVFGMNVGGMPLANHENGFLFLCIGMVVWVACAMIYSSTITK